MAGPELKQFAQLSPSDFRRHPVWVQCHVEDYDQPWYDDTDEETFRPWLGELPVGTDGGFLVRAEILLGDGTKFEGFMTPSPDASPGFVQPHVFADGEAHGFWWGILDLSSRVGPFLQKIGRSEEEVFPVRAIAVPGLALGISEIEMSGWGRAGGAGLTRAVGSGRGRRRGRRRWR